MTPSESRSAAIRAWRTSIPPLVTFAIPALAVAIASLVSVFPRDAHSKTVSIARPQPRVELPAGRIEGSREQADSTQLDVFRGIPYAAAPVGALRWREPQPVERWAGVRDAKRFAPRCMQVALFRDMKFRSDTMSEDCLYLNVWTPARSPDEKLPVLVYFHGGSFSAGDSSEPRYDGASLAARGIVSVTVNYRLGVFGFLTLPQLAQESPHGASGNYGMLDQVAALQWVRENIARFGGDPQKVTIGGESSGAMSVNTHMASPLSRGLFARAIGESGSTFASGTLWSRQKAEKNGQAFVRRLGATSLVALRNVTALDLLRASRGGYKLPMFFWPVVDGYFLTEQPATTFRNGAQAQVPLLVGTNSHEADQAWLEQNRELTPALWRASLTALFRERADEALALYPGVDANEIAHASTTLAGDMALSHGVWRWMDTHRTASHAPVYFYLYTHARPAKRNAPPGAPAEPGAMHASEIEYMLGNLDREPSYAWTADDREVSRLFSGYAVQFVKHGNPNGATLPDWPAVREDQGGLLRQVIDTRTETQIDRSAARHAFLESEFAKGRFTPGAAR
ncbi:carboxylesterase/lipase family protein [Trinickia fusca]|uniref:Carboxylic ester hydrolase n=1 Tax=Trinickia fusca TaxID=2419777 RepID=A0A494XF67_9BURK|nr:carboxylesterase/lipase family protein [Trinickia fusca]RKP49447.1 carboxylesterase family protein [Trinickia fusca]